MYFHEKFWIEYKTITLVNFDFRYREMKTSLKEKFDFKVIVSALKKNSKTKENGLKTHLIFASNYYATYVDQLKLLILKAMKKCRTNSLMVTLLDRTRWFLITKEEMENYCKGKEDAKDSVNDDLESFFEDLRLGKEPEEDVSTYFLPKLTGEELESVEKEDMAYLETLIYHTDVEEAEMMHSESDSKFVYESGSRKTFTMNRFNADIENLTELENTLFRVENHDYNDFEGWNSS